MKRLDPEIKAMRALERAVAPLDDAARRRTVLWFAAREMHTTQGVIEGRVPADDGYVPDLTHIRAVQPDRRNGSAYRIWALRFADDVLDYADRCSRRLGVGQA